MSLKHPSYGTPSRAWPYHLADGRLGAFDFTKDGKAVQGLPADTFCDLGAGRRGWRSKGIPDPHPALPAAAAAGPTRGADPRDGG
jgi:putative DNA primase/helicase